MKYNHCHEIPVIRDIYLLLLILKLEAKLEQLIDEPSSLVRGMGNSSGVREHVTAARVQPCKMKPEKEQAG